LVVHPGPPGDAGPSSLDWVLLGDTGRYESSADTLTALLSADIPSPIIQRSHWGSIVFQANEHLDGGAIWAWEQYLLPPIGSITKAQLYQTLHSQAAILALITAILRVYDTHLASSSNDKMSIVPKQEWQEKSISHGCAFLGGDTHERSLLQSKQRKPDLALHTADDVCRIINASDSQPGAQLSALTSNSKTALFAYGAHIHVEVRTVPEHLYSSLGYDRWEDVPSGRVIAIRADAVFVKTKEGGSGCGIWITHGRIPKKAGSPLEPKIPMVQAIIAAGHGEALDGVQDWTLEAFTEIPGSWQEVFVRTINRGERGLAQLVYWDF
jgi:hypothetical protein